MSKQGICEMQVKGKFKFTRIPLCALCPLW